MKLCPDVVGSISADDESHLVLMNYARAKSQIHVLYGHERQQLRLERYTRLPRLMHQ